MKKLIVFISIMCAIGIAGSFGLFEWLSDPVENNGWYVATIFLMIVILYSQSIRIDKLSSDLSYVSTIALNAKCNVNVCHRGLVDISRRLSELENSKC